MTIYMNIVWKYRDNILNVNIRSEDKIFQMGEIMRKTWRRRRSKVTQVTYIDKLLLFIKRTTLFDCLLKIEIWHTQNQSLFMKEESMFMCADIFDVIYCLKRNNKLILQFDNKSFILHKTLIYYKNKGSLKTYKH